MDWPKLSDGTVDWMTVFQDPKLGLIPLINQSDTSDKLRDCFRYVINALFARDNDTEVRETYYGILDETFDLDEEDAADALGGQKIKIRMVMMRVMNDRIQLAREYAALKAAEGDKALEERREKEPRLETVAV
jgi:hypothetical protein